MPAGRPRKPIERAQQLAKGDGRSPGNRLVPMGGAQNVTRRLEVPDPVVPLGPRGAAEWEKLWTAGFWLKPDQDYIWVEQICQSFDMIEAFNEEIANTGLMVEGSMGQQAAHPLIGERLKLWQHMAKCLSALGFSPSDRARLNLTEAQTASKLQQMMDRNNRQ